MANVLVRNIVDGKEQFAIESVTGTAYGWQPQSDWAGVSTFKQVADNEIHLLCADGDIAFAVTVASSGTYSIDWGDGTTETLRASGTTYQHRYTIGAGTPCAQGYTTFKIRIYAATGNITRYETQKTSYTSSGATEISPVIWAVFGTRYLTTCQNLLYSTYVRPKILEYFILPGQADGISFQNIALGAASLAGYEYGKSLNTVGLLSSAFSTTRIKSLIFSTGTSLCTDMTTLVSESGITAFEFPSDISNVTTISSMAYLSTVAYVKCPTALKTGTIVCNSAFAYCFNLKKIDNLQYLGSSTVQTNMMSILQDCCSLNQDLVIGSLISAIGIYGSSATSRVPTTSIRLTNTGSTLTGTAPQVNVAYTDLPTAAINQLILDVAAMNCTAKTMKITGDTGMVRVAPTTTTYTLNSDQVTVNSAASLTVGMYCNTMSRSVTLTDTGDLVTFAAHGLQNGDKVFFSVITTTTGISINTPYYVVNATTDTFQVSLTSGGAAQALTTDGTGTLKYLVYIQAINGTTLTISRISSLAGANATVFLNVEPAPILLKGFTLTTT